MADPPRPRALKGLEGRPLKGGRPRRPRRARPTGGTSPLRTEVSGGLVLLFDGSCGPCTRLAGWIRRRDSAGRIRVQPNQAPGVLSAHGLTRAEVDRSAWAIEPGGRRLEGAAALNRVLEELGGGWRLLALPYRRPILAGAEEAAYRWVAANRRRLAWLGVTPECERPGVACGE